MTFRLKEIMKEKGVTQKTLASEVGISTVAMSNIINEKYSPSIKTLESMANYLHVPMWQIFADPAEVVTEKVEVEKKIPEFIICPHCGMAIPVEVKVRKLT